MLAAIDTLTAAPAPLLVIVDFDGTLTPGSRDPGAARIDPLARRALQRLAGLRVIRPDRIDVAVLTGRTVADVAARARVGGIEYHGDHGLQRGWLERRARARSIVVTPEPGFEGQERPAEALAVGVASVLGHPAWLFVERKGPSVAFHVRQADDIPAAREAVLSAIAAVERRDALGDHGLTPYRGRSVVDLRPRDAGGKREATERLIAQHRPGAVLALGDDLSDAEAFDALHEALAARRIAHGLAIAVHGRLTAPPDVIARADLVINSSREVARLLGGIARRLTREVIGPGDTASEPGRRPGEPAD